MSELTASLTTDTDTHYYVPIDQFLAMLDYMRATVTQTPDPRVKAFIFVLTQDGLKLIIETQDDLGA